MFSSTISPVFPLFLIPWSFFMLSLLVLFLRFSFYCTFLFFRFFFPFTFLILSFNFYILHYLSPLLNPPPLHYHSLPPLLRQGRARIYILIYQFPAAAEAVMDGVLPAPRICHELPWWLPAESATRWALHHSAWWKERLEKRKKKESRAKKLREKWEEHEWRRE